MEIMDTRTGNMLSMMIGDTNDAYSWLRLITAQHFGGSTRT